MIVLSHFCAESKGGKAKPSQYAIYMATIDYMIASYGPYSASATGGNGLARDFLAGIAAMYATPSE